MASLSRFIEHTALSPTVVGKDIDKLVAEAREHSFLGVCVPPFWVKRASREIGESDIQLVTVIGFPLGYQMTQTKIEETKQAIADGANELDVVMNISAFKEGMTWVKIELAKLGKLIHGHDCMMKVIIETAYLSNDEIANACKLAIAAGTDFVKTSTGFAGGGAKVEHVKIMREVSPSNVGVKASGGIKNAADAQAMLAAGADRIGTSSGVAIVNS